MTALFEDMLASRPVHAGKRRAALMLHALSAADRQWVLASLTEADRQVLGAMLGELRELGVPPDLAAELCGPRSAAMPEDSLDRAESPRAGAGRAAALTAALVDEPTALVDAALALQDPVVRREVSAALARPAQTSAAVPVRMARSLEQHLAMRLARHEDVAAPRLGTMTWRRRFTRVLPQGRGGIGRLVDAFLGRSTASSGSRDPVSHR